MTPREQRLNKARNLLDADDMSQQVLLENSDEDIDGNTPFPPKKRDISEVYRQLNFCDTLIKGNACSNMIRNFTESRKELVRDFRRRNKERASVLEIQSDASSDTADEDKVPDSPLERSAPGGLLTPGGSLRKRTFSIFSDSSIDDTPRNILPRKERGTLPLCHETNFIERWLEEIPNPFRRSRREQRVAPHSESQSNRTSSQPLNSRVAHNHSLAMIAPAA